MALLLLLPACDKVPLLAPSGSTITLFAAQNVLPVNGWTDIVATVVEAAGTPVQNGTLVTFSTTIGTIEPSEARTSNGKVTVRFNSGGRSGTAEIRAFSGGAVVEEPLEIGIGAAVADSVQLSATPGTVPSSGGTVQVTATVIDVNGNRLPGVPVGFSTTAGTLSASTLTTDANGQATVSLNTTREAVVTARVGAKTADFTVRINPAPVITVTASPSSAVVTQPVTVTVTPGPLTGVLSNVRIEWGDGRSDSIPNVSGSGSRTHSYCAPGPYTVTVTGRDLNGENGFGSAGVAITPLAPFTVSGNNATVRQSVNLTALVPSGAIITRYEWNFGDGSPIDPTIGPSNTHSYQAPGPYTVRVAAVSSQCGVVSTAATGVNISP